MARSLRFEGGIKKVEIFCGAGPWWIYIRCCGIGHECLEKCGEKPKKYVIYSGKHQIHEHQCEVAGCNKGRGKLCIHIIVWYTNCSRIF